MNPSTPATQNTSGSTGYQDAVNVTASMAKDRSGRRALDELRGADAKPYRRPGGTPKPARLTNSDRRSARDRWRGCAPHVRSHMRARRLGQRPREIDGDGAPATEFQPSSQRLDYGDRELRIWCSQLLPFASHCSSLCASALRSASIVSRAVAVSSRAASFVKDSHEVNGGMIECSRLSSSSMPRTQRRADMWQVAYAAVPGTDGGLMATAEPMRSISLCGADGLPLRNCSRRSVVNRVPVGIPD
jgi:hypothetical protein